MINHMRAFALGLIVAASAFAQDPVAITPYQLLTTDANKGLLIPCVNCSIFTYIAGTDTPAETFTDSSLNVANTNPVLTNGSGYAVNGSTITGIWVGAQCLKLVAQDADLVTLWSQDNVCDQVQVLKALLAGTAGSSLIGYKYSSSATARTVQDRLQDYVSVKDFGAVGDGVHNDTASIQAAYAGCGGNILYFPAGQYLTNSINIVNPNDNTQIPGVNGGCTIEGAGIGRTILIAASPSDVLLSAVSTGTVHYPYYNIHDLTLQGPDAFTSCIGGGTPTGTGAGLRITGTAQASVRLENLLLVGFCGSGGFGLWVDKAEEIQMDKVAAFYNETGIKLGGTSDVNSSLFNKVQVDQNIYGMTIIGLIGGHFADLLVQSNYKTGLYMTLTGGNTFSSAYFEHNNSSLTAGEYALKMDSAVSGNTSNFFTSPLFVTISDGIYMSGDATGGHVTSGNYFLGIVPNAFQQGAKINLANAYATGNTWSGVLPGNFTSDPLPTEIFLDASGAFTSGVRTMYVPQFVNRNYTLDIPGDHSTTLANISHSSTATPGTGRTGLAYSSIGTPLASDQGIWDLGESSRGQTLTFYEDGGNNTRLWFNYRAASTLTKGFGVILKSNHSITVHTPGLFAGLDVCGDIFNAPEGSEASITDSTTDTWGATATGGGALHVRLYCDGTNWTVMGK